MSNFKPIPVKLNIGR